jgi:hypothetical protein
MSAQVAPPFLRSGCPGLSPWFLWTEQSGWPGLLPGLCPYRPSCCSVSLSSRWSSRWLLPSQETQALDRLGPAGLQWAPREAGCCGRSQVSPAPPVLSLKIICPGACPCSAIGLEGWIEEEVAEIRNVLHYCLDYCAQLCHCPRSAPCGSLPVIPPSPREMLSCG